MPQKIHCIARKKFDYDIIMGDFVEIKGVVKFNEKSQEIYLEVQTLKIISQEEANVQLSQHQSSFFNEENLKILTDDTMSGIVQILTNKATQEGFKLVRKISIKEERLTLFCHQHANFGKDVNLNTGCEFKIRIGSFMKGNNKKLSHYKL